MENDLEKIIVECAKNIKKRKELFFKIGQDFLKPLKDRALEEKTFEIFQLIIKHEKDWKGEVLIPEYYRLDKKKSIFKDIWYTLRDYIAWCILYPEEVDNYFKHDKSGKVEILLNPKVRIIDKDNTKQVTKTENGKVVNVNVKKERTFVIISGFTLEQKDTILSICVAGLLEDNNNPKKKSEKKSKTIDSKEQSTKSLAELDDTFDKLNQEVDNNKEVGINKKATRKKVKKANTEDNSETTSTDKPSEQDITPKKKATSKKKEDKIQKTDNENEQKETTVIEDTKQIKKTTKNKKKE